MKSADCLVSAAALCRLLFATIRSTAGWLGLSLVLTSALSATTRFVDPGSAAPTAPYTSWATAAHTLPEALALCTTGDTTYVAPGTYVLSATLTIPGGVTLECPTGPGTATLDGNNLVRCVNMPAPGATLKGFTVTGGRAHTGAGVYCVEGTVTQCIISGNHATGDTPKGGGLFCDGALISYCTVTHNDCTSTNSDAYAAFAEGGGIHAINQSQIRNCSVLSNSLVGNYANGAGINANNGSVIDCIVSSNTAAGHWYAYGGGLYMTGNVDGLARNCLITANNAHTDTGAFSSNWAAGGGVYFNGGGLLESSTVCDNVLAGDAATGSGVMYGERVRNSILVGNTYTARLASIGDPGPNYYLNPYGTPVAFDHSCTTPLPSADGNITAAPVFVTGTYRLAPGSPCVDTGLNQTWSAAGTDLDGNPRTANSTVDMGAYERTASAMPSFTEPPSAAIVYANNTATFSASTAGLFPMTFQWRKDNVPIAGATGRTLTLPGVRASDLALYSVTVTNAAGSLTSQPVPLSLSPSRFINLSINTEIEPATPVTAGFIIKGGTKTLLLRGAGPALAQYLPNALADPRLSVYQQSNITTPKVSNDNWGDAANRTELAFATTRYTGLPFAEGSSDAAALTPLAESEGGYTVQITTASGAGITLAEVYDADSNLAARLTNLSANRRITSSQKVTAGFVIEGTLAKEVLIRGVGPALANYGVPTGFLPDARLTVYDITDSRNTVVVATNDNWSSDASNRTTVLSATTRAGVGLLLGEGSKDAAVVLSLLPGHLYTAEVSSADGAGGIVLVEVYEVP